tara:strand:- start:241 stop:711 length:471 start_codon:yes stop_codon:yes gene_type:complete
MRKIGIHTPKKTQEYFNALINGTNLKWEDTSWKSDWSDSIGNDKFYLVLPNSENDNGENGEFNTFILSNEYEGDIYIQTTNILEIIKYINTNKTKTMEKLTHEEVIKYARWVYHESDTPIGEIEWLSEMLLNDRPKEDIKKEFIDNIKELLPQLNN